MTESLRQRMATDPRLANLSASELDAIEEIVSGPPPTIHQCPPTSSHTMPCCDRTPFEVSPTDRMTLDPTAVTCAPSATVTSGDMAVELPGIEPNKVVDLMEALEQSVAAAKAARRQHPKPAAREDV